MTTDTVRVREEDLAYPAHFHAALLELVLCRLATIEQPHIPVEAKSKGRVVTRRRRLGGGCPKECDVQCCDAGRGHC